MAANGELVGWYGTYRKQLKRGMQSARNMTETMAPVECQCTIVTFSFSIVMIVLVVVVNVICVRHRHHDRRVLQSRRACAFCWCRRMKAVGGCEILCCRHSSEKRYYYEI
jgi:hypothetical protein